MEYQIYFLINFTLVKKLVSKLKLSLGLIELILYSDYKFKLPIYINTIQYNCIHLTSLVQPCVPT